MALETCKHYNYLPMQIDWIHVGGSPHDTLDWAQELERARSCGRKIFWRLNLGLEQPFFPLEDELRFQALALALQQFTNQVWPEFQEKTAGVCIYRGSADFSERYPWTDRQQSNFAGWLEGRADSPALRRLFCADSFAIYFQMLAHRLPDEAPIFLLLDATGLTPLSHALQVLSKDRFQHFELALRGNRLLREGYTWEGDALSIRTIPGTVGLVFPSSSDPNILRRFDQLMESSPAKILFEPFLTEEWEGLDQLVVISEGMSLQTVRKLKGFCAAGGEVTSYGPALGLSAETNCK